MPNIAREGTSDTRKRVLNVAPTRSGEQTRTHDHYEPHASPPRISPHLSDARKRVFNHGSGEKTAIRVDGIFLLKQIASCNAAIVDLLLLPNSFKRILLVSELDEPAVDGLVLHFEVIDRAIVDELRRMY